MIGTKQAGEATQEASTESRIPESLRFLLQIRAPSVTSNRTPPTARMRFSLTSLPRR